MNSENSKTSETHVLILKLSGKFDLRRGEESIALSNLSIYYTWKNLKYQLQHGMIHLSYQMSHLLYQIFKTILTILKKT